MNRKLLSDFPANELMEELSRRMGLKHRDNPIPPCDECAYFRAFEGPGEVPKNWKCCAKNHAQKFRLPSTGNPDDTPWGFYRRFCEDRAPKELLAP